MDVFDRCQGVNEMLLAGNEAGARDDVIQLLADLKAEEQPYPPLVNHLVRMVGLFPYVDRETSSWEDRFVTEAFKADVGGSAPVTLHREQSRLLNALLDGKDIAVSAPTSFGKSFVVDSFIAIRQPTTVVILVPTIALADETRRRLQRKYGSKYKIITTSNQPLAEKNILVCPQERALGYIGVLKQIDILIVDEFYKASRAFDRERSPALINAILRLSALAHQRYFLAPNIDNLVESDVTAGMEFLPLERV